jgi:ribosome recycling factor
MSEVKTETESRMTRTLETLKKEFLSIHTGRAHTSMIDSIVVDYYGTPTPISQMAACSIPDPRTIQINPWDKGIVKNIEKAIFSSNIGLTPVVDGSNIRIKVPDLTEDRRLDLVKQSKRFAEDARVALRNIRQKMNEAVKKSKKDGQISEDEEKKRLHEVQQCTDDNVKKIDELAAQKEKDLKRI